MRALPLATSLLLAACGPQEPRRTESHRAELAEGREAGCVAALQSSCAGARCLTDGEVSVDDTDSARVTWLLPEHCAVLSVRRSGADSTGELGVLLRTLAPLDACDTVTLTDGEAEPLLLPAELVSWSHPQRDAVGATWSRHQWARLAAMQHPHIDLCGALTIEIEASRWRAGIARLVSETSD